MGVDSDTAERWRTEDEDYFLNAPRMRVPMKLYTAGPMSWIPRFNYPAFMALADTLRAEGYEVVSPAELDSPEMQAKCEASVDGNPADLGNDETWGDLLSRDVKLIADEVDGVVLLPGWEESKGARLEAFVARHVGKPVFYWIGGGGDGDEATHNAICHCQEWYLFPAPGGPTYRPLLELDDAELDHVLTAADTLTLMKMERDKIEPEDDIRWDAPSVEEIRILGSDEVIRIDPEKGTRIESASPDGTWMESEGVEQTTDSGGYIVPDEWAPDVEGMKRETRVTDPDTGGEKGSKLARFDLIPARPLREIAEHYGKGAEKYDDRNWELGYDWSLSYAAMQRHLNAWWGGEDIDPETGSNHLTAAAWHCLALLEWTWTHDEKDDRP